MNRLIGVVLIAMLFTFSNCDNEVGVSQIPIADFPDFNINLNLPEFLPLNRDGGSMVINEIGLRGVILYRENQSSYIAYEITCPYEPSSACANVEVHSSTLFMVDPCCNSTFSFPDGLPTGGPARFPLRIYETIQSGSQLIITSNVIN